MGKNMNLQALENFYGMASRPPVWKEKKERISNEEEKKSGSGSFLMVISITREGVNNSRWLVAAANTHYRHHR